MDFEATLKEYRQRVEDALRHLLPPATTRPALLHEAMRYSLEAGGKRLRPVLLVAAHAVYPSLRNPYPAAVALECLHTYSLIHDDLPCMDDSDLRRGRPTCHRQFNEETALLAGDALLTYAFWMLAEHYRDEPRIATELIRDFGSAAGSEHLIGGQMEDLLGEKEAPSIDRLEFIHANKTGALLTTSLTMGFRLGARGEDFLDTMREAGRQLGLAFQIVDDLLDVTSDAATMGKPVGADGDNQKMTYPALFGVAQSREEAYRHTEEAIRRFETIGGNNAFLIALARHMESRIN